MDGIAVVSLVAPVVDLVTIVVVSIGVYFASRQELTRYRDAKPLLVLTWSAFLGVVIVQFASDTYYTVALSRIYTLIEIPLVFTGVAVLSMLSYVIYARHGEALLSDRIRAMFGPRNRISALLLIAFTAYLVFLAFYVLLFQPFTIVVLPDIFGSLTDSTVFDTNFLPMLVLVLIGYLGYACGHLLLAARNLPSRATARVLGIFALGWVVTGLSLFLVVGYSTSFGVDATALGFLIVAVSFSVSVNLFRRGSSLAGFFEPMRSVVPETHPFTGRIAMGRASFRSGGGVMLLEVDPSSGYDDVVRDFAVEQVSNGSSLFVFTSRGKPVYEAIQQVQQARFFIMTDEVTYPKPGSQPLEVLVPQRNEAVLLSVIERTLAEDTESRIGLVFDSVTDLIVVSGFERAYKFLKQVLEITSDKRIAAVFLLVGEAHEEKVLSVLKSLFTTHLVFNASGLRVARRP
jgi:hypothetical protein